MPLDTLHNARLDPELKALADVPLSRLINSPMSTGNGDWNSVTTPGHHDKLMYGGGANGPGDTNYYYLEVRSYAGSEILQIATQYHLAISAPAVVTRHRYNGSWGPWRRIFAQEDKPYFSAYHISAVTKSAGVVKLPICGGTTENRGSNYSTSTGRFTAPISGLYHFGVHVGLGGGAAAEAYLSAEIYRNGSRYLSSGWRKSATSGYQQTTGVFAVNLLAGDYIEPGSETQAAHTLNYGTLFPVFWGYLIG